jgi:hypothetical protein
MLDRCRPTSYVGVILFISFLDLWPLLPTHCRCRGLLLYLIILSDTNTLGRTPLYEWSARRRDLYLTTHNTHKIQTAMPPAEFEPVIPVSERPQTHALDHVATGNYFPGSDFSTVRLTAHEPLLLEESPESAKLGAVGVQLCLTIICPWMASVNVAN